MSFENVLLLCFARYENLKGKYFEIKRAQMNGEQRPYWLYFNEMDYIISHFPGHRPRINLDVSNAAAATQAATGSSGNNSTMSIENSNSNTNASTNSDFADTKPPRLNSSNLDNSGNFIHDNNSILLVIRSVK